MRLCWVDCPLVVQWTEFPQTICNRSGHLLHVVVKFPNSRSIKLGKNWTELDLSIIKSLRKLSKIEFHRDSRSEWAEFESLLEYGSQIERLEVEHDIFYTTQQSLDSIFRLWKNLEVMTFDCQSNSQESKLVVPPFDKLEKMLSIYNVIAVFRNVKAPTFPTWNKRYK